MLDMRWIRENAQEVQWVAEQKGIACNVEQLLDCDLQKRTLQQNVDELRRQRNAQSQEIGQLLRAGDETLAEPRKAAVKEMNERLAALEQQLLEVEEQLNEWLLLVPNVVSADTPIGRSDEDNVEVKRVGEPTVVEFDPKDHVTLGELHDIIDIPRGVKAAGTRNYYLKGAGVLLHRAVQQLAIDLLLRKGFTLLDVPLVVRGESLSNTAFFPLGKDQTFQIADEDKWLVGTAEVPLVTYYANEVVDLSAPVKLAAVSNCFRSEVGSAGKDVNGLYRVHQFAKVEQVVLCEADPEVSERLHQEITANAEELLQLLELPYRMVAVCTGDMTQKTYKQFDIETWMPSRQAYGETHSSSNLHDFQARRSNIRYRDADGKLRHAHTLNNTAVASPRILIPLLENHQQADGSIRIPEALRPYMYGMEQLIAPQP